MTFDHSHPMKAILRAVRGACAGRTRAECLTNEDAPSFWFALANVGDSGQQLLDLGGMKAGPLVIKVMSRAEFSELPSARGFPLGLVPVVVADATDVIVLGYDLETQDWAVSPEVVH